MNVLSGTQCRSPDALRDAATQWDNLWQHSEVVNPLGQAALVALWADHFSPRCTFRALQIRDGAELVDALPLVGRRRAKFFELGSLPSNVWASCGDLLLDPAADPSTIAERLIQEIDVQPWRLAELSPVVLDAPRWQAIRAACRRQGIKVTETVSALVGQVEIGDDWQAYRSRWSKNHRRHIDKAARRARLAGRLTLEVRTEFRPGEIRRLLQLGFEIENRSWKGQAGTSVLRTPGIFAFFVEQAEQLAQRGQLQLAFLEINDRAIAFEYGYRAKGTYFSHKVGYDPDYADYSPGQLLRAMLFERFHQQDEISLVDFCGPLTEATAKWSTRCYPVGKWLIAPRRFLGRCALRAHRAARLARRLASGLAAQSVFPRGAAGTGDMTSLCGAGGSTHTVAD